VKFAARAALIRRELESVPGFVTVAPNAAFYAFPEISAHFGKTSPAGTRIASAQAFADALLDEAHVAVVPGEDFGACARGHIRFSFACADENIVKGVARVREWVAKLR
jgi:aspartate/methionine/tyrosine aminotransferase